jgi:RHS repeat-associated protein
MPGQYFDAETGLNYNYFRDYDPSTGRYVESDPIGLAGGVNTYCYANGNPIANIDAMGMAVEGWWITPPRLNLAGIQITNARLTLSLSAWGKLGLVNQYGNIEGYVNVDVHCKDGCRT